MPVRAINEWLATQPRWEGYAPATRAWNLDAYLYAHNIPHRRGHPDRPPRRYARWEDYEADMTQWHNDQFHRS
jgi:hypothetical protein